MHRAAIIRLLSPIRGGPLTGLSGGRPLSARPDSAGGAQVDVPVGVNVAVRSVADARITASMDLVDSALEKGVRASDVAAKFALSRSRFGHLFRAQTGLAFRQYVRAAPLARAKLLLRDMRLRVEEVAWQCGYAHTSNLDREFEREFGLSPSDYRRSTSG
ncbi:MAG: AraC family transcriptional regulator [Terriglobia bacterium]